jgi:NodT family efflux transporter outer membrane factor (OMF) lipoprotein
MKYSNHIKITLLLISLLFFTSCSSIKSFFSAFEKAGKPVSHEEAIQEVKKEEKIEFKTPTEFAASKKYEELQKVSNVNDNNTIKANNPTNTDSDNNTDNIKGTITSKKDNQTDNISEEIDLTVFETDNSVDDGWLKTFHDKKLEELVAEALKKNPGLKLAEAQVDRALALAGLAESDLKPTISLGVGGNTGNIYANNVGFAGATVSWEADVWGRVRNTVSAQKEEVMATLADFQFARQSLAASIAKGWFMATEAKLQKEFAKEIVDIRKENLRIAEAKYKIGQGNERDIHLAKASLASAKKAHRKAIAAYENAQRSLEVLLGRYPSADLQATDKIIAVPPKLPKAIPSQLLERRPDLIAAEHKVAKAFYKKTEAELLHLPKFSFQAGVGLSSITDIISGLTAGIFAPLYTGGAIEAEVAKATAEQKATIANYAKKALQAFKEVENALSSEVHLKIEEDNAKIQTKENKIAYEQTKKQYEFGQITYLDVLNVQNKWVNSKIIEIDMRTKRLINRVNLHLAIGGSFEKTNKK